MSSKKSVSKTLMLILILGIFFLTYNIVLFSITGISGHGGSFWISYAFMILSFVVVSIEGKIIKERTVQPKDWLLGYPIIKHAILYFVVEFICSIMFIVLDCLIACPAWIALVVQLVVLAIHMMLALMSLITHDAIKEVQTQVKASTIFIKSLQIEVENMATRVSEPETKADFSKLAEQIRYSDPVSNEQLKAIENQIRTHVTNAAGFLMNNDFVKARQCCRQASLSLEERNRMCKLYK